MTDFNYMAPAELFVGMGRGNARGNAMKYNRFPTSAEAIRHAVGKLNANALSGAAVVVDESAMALRKSVNSTMIRGIR